MGKLLYQIEIRHAGLHEYKIVKGSTTREAEEKARVQLAKWDQKWQRLQQRVFEAETKDQKKELASQRTEEAKQAIREIEDLLASSLKSRHAIVWEKVFDKSAFPEAPPIVPQKPHVPPAPLPTDLRFQPKLNLFDRLFASFRERKIQQAQQSLVLATKSWEERRQQMVSQYRDHAVEYNQKLAGWNKRLKVFQNEQSERNKSIESLRQRSSPKNPRRL